MKKISNFKLNGLNPLSNSELKTIMGGQGFTCYCGYVSGDWEDSTFSVEANGIIGALNSAGSQCGGLGATCSGNEQLPALVAR